MQYYYLIPLALAFLIIIWYVGTYNRLVGFRIRVEEAFSTIDVFLKKRHDLIPNLVETVKGYAAHERETLDAVIKARSNAYGSSGIEQKIHNESELGRALGKLMVLAESYPNLKADGQFINLQNQLQSVEGDISQSRKYYNGVVKSYNTLLVTFPSVLVARISKFDKAEFFTAGEEERENVKVSFQ